MTILHRYVSRLLLARILTVLLVLVALLEIMDLIDNVDDVLDRRGSMADLLIFVGYRLPTIMESAIPISVLLGSLMFFLAIASRSEVDALRSAGVSQLRLLWLCLPVILIIATFHFLLVDRFVPASQKAFNAWWETPINQGDVLWIRGDDSIVSLVAMENEAHLLRGVTIYRRDDDGRLNTRLKADRAEFDQNGWQLFEVEEQILSPGSGTQVVDHPTKPWPGGPDPETIAMLQEDPERLMATGLSAILSSAWSGGTEIATYRTELAHRYVAPLISAVMLLLATPALRRSGRSAAALAGAALGLGLGLGFVVIDGIVVALGRAGLIDAIVAAWAALCFFTLIGLWLVRSSET